MALQPGTRFGRYELVSRLGRGGMAETYRARLVGEAGVTKPVLIKKVLPEYANDQAFTTMFISEARISATLSHGNIAQVYDFGRVDGEYFLAMEFVDGQPLHRILKRALRLGGESIPLPIACFIGIEMCRGLHYAHSRTDDGGKPLDIVHRDISPDNVLVSYEGQVKIVDFGIAKARELRGFNTEPGVVKGKFLFFSPEQARGHDVDARTDVWATGIVLYEMLCGTLPVQGPQYVVVPRLMKGDFPRPRQLNPGVPEELEDIVMQALTVDRNKRFASCHELGDALAGFLYSTEPRFSAMSLSHYVQELFKEDLAAEGRQVQVPRSFQEQLARWQSMAVATSPSQPPVSPEAQLQEIAAKGAPAEVAHRKSLYIGLGAGVAVTVFALLLAFVVMGEPQLLGAEKAAGVSPPTPLKPSTPPPVGSSPKASPAEPSDGDRARSAAEMAARYMAVKKYKDASISALLCLEFEPKNADCQLLAARAYEGMGDTSKALDRYRAFLSLAPGDARAVEVKKSIVALGGADLSDPAMFPRDEAGEEARQAYTDASSLLRAQQYPEALNRASKCVELSPKNADCFMLLGAASAGMKQYDTAMVAYRRFLQLAPDHRLAPKVRKTMEDYARSKPR